jgi:choline kinase
MFEFIVFSLFIISFIGLMIGNIKLKIKVSTLTLKILEERIDKNIIIDKAKKEIENEKKVEDTEGFLKFISDSRDWAFSYIEQVQAGLEKFDKNAGKHIRYFNQFAELSDGQPLHDILVEISKEYEDLKKLLPADYGKIE